MRLKAMHEYTAKLPLIEREHLSDFIGKNTEMALRTGGQFGAAMEADGFILKYKKQFGEIRVVATGGDAPFIKRYTQQTVEHQPDLLMQGLFAILQQNILPT
jgi:type III pantothenate kinase